MTRSGPGSPGEVQEGVRGLTHKLVPEISLYIGKVTEQGRSTIKIGRYIHNFRKHVSKSNGINTMVVHDVGFA